VLCRAVAAHRPDAEHARIASGSGDHAESTSRLAAGPWTHAGRNADTWHRLAVGAVRSRRAVAAWPDERYASFESGEGAGLKLTRRAAAAPAARYNRAHRRDPPAPAPRHAPRRSAGTAQDRCRYRPAWW